LLSLPVHISNGTTLSVQVRKLKRAKRLCLKANIFGIHVVVPMINYEIEEVIRFLVINKDQNTMGDSGMSMGKSILN
jgi:hypothetical protein